MKHIMIIDDDACIVEMLRETLVRAGYEVTRAYSGTEALLAIDNRRPDLILLDLMLPGLSGEEVLAQIRGIPIIVISARGDVEDKVRLLLDGAADYLAKPFDTRELLARITVALRKAPAPAASDRLIYKSVVMDTLAHQVTVDGQAVRLTKTEFAILRLLLANPTQIISRSLLLDRLAEMTPDGVDSSLKVHISNLRKKLREADHEHRDFIETVWGIGFRLAEPA